MAELSRERIYRLIDELIEVINDDPLETAPPELLMAYYAELNRLNIARGSEAEEMLWASTP